MRRPLDKLRIAVIGQCHGEIERVYNRILKYEQRHRRRVHLLLVQ